MVQPENVVYKENKIEKELTPKMSKTTLLENAERTTGGLAQAGV